jgi:hypothetical protein
MHMRSKYLFLICLPTISEIFLENWKADPTLNRSIPISVARRGVWNFLITRLQAKASISRRGHSNICISSPVGVLGRVRIARSAAWPARPPSTSRHASREIMLISTA